MRIQFKMITTEGKTITTPLVHFGTCLLGFFSSSHSLTLSRSKQDRGVHSLCLSLSSLRLTQIRPDTFRWWLPVAREEADARRLL
jgi:hypothetical protein